MPWGDAFLKFQYSSSDITQNIHCKQLPVAVLYEILVQFYSSFDFFHSYSSLFILNEKVKGKCLPEIEPWPLQVVPFMSELSGVSDFFVSGVMMSSWRILPGSPHIAALLTGYSLLSHYLAQKGMSVFV